LFGINTIKQPWYLAIMLLYHCRTVVVVVLSGDFENFLKTYAHVFTEFTANVELVLI
jgi:hypothetical protein